jgi:hypothetical protein
LEKPLAGDHAGLAVLDGAVGRHGLDRLFLFGYYALERALALRILAAGGDVDSVYLACTEPSLSTDAWAVLWSRLGVALRMEGVILEGRTEAASLEHRPWVLDPRGGGNTLETLYHLVCVAGALAGDGRVRAREVHLAVHQPTAERYPRVHGAAPAETLSSARLESGSLDIALAAAKSVEPSLHQRWIAVGFAHGQAVADLERSTLTIQEGNANPASAFAKPQDMPRSSHCLPRRSGGRRRPASTPCSGKPC